MEVLMKFFIWLMSCSVLLLLNGCYYPGHYPQRPPVVRPPIVQPPQPGVCGGIAGWGCPSGQFCDFGRGRCNMPDAQGTCKQRPEMCPRIYKPVCGCDGRTYANRCEAKRAGITIRYKGQCGDVRSVRPRGRRR
ncbi:MAG: Kazal domain-containing protein [Candidatus Electrothrix sp. AR5]|nr:Kazal domain-containing protein [Candidatus Electrothrix sp. AR5]